MDAASQGKEALANSDPVSAIVHFTRALAQLPRASNYYIQRATAYSRVKPADGGPHPEDALRDAEIALVLAEERGTRELLLAAQMRRAVSLFQLERYGDANFLLERIESMTDTWEVPEYQGEETDIDEAMSKAKAKKKATIAELPIWVVKVRRKLSELGDGDKKATVSVVEYPSDTKVPTEQELKEELKRLKEGKPARAVGGTTQEPTQQSSTTPAAAMGQKKDAADSVDPDDPPKVRHQWYQSQDSVVLSVYLKDVPVPTGKAETYLKDESVSVEFPLPSGSMHVFTLGPLYAPIDTAASKVTVWGTKLEIVLMKQTPGQKWSTLVASGTTTELADRPAAPATPTAGPAYPTSSRKGVKDWDKVAASLTSKGKGKEEDAGNESDDSEYGGDAVDGFFKKLYAGADPETRRAMMKSYVESEGTTLSTDWSEVGKDKVKPHHPN